MNPVSSAKKGGFIGIDHATTTNNDKQAPLLSYRYNDHSLQIEETTIAHDNATVHVRHEIEASTLEEGLVTTIQHVVYCQQKDKTPILIIICSTGKEHDYVAFWYNVSTRQTKRIELPIDFTSKITSVSITETPSRMPKSPAINSKDTTNSASKRPEKEDWSHAIAFTLSDGSTCIGLLILYPDEILFDTHEYIDPSLVDDEDITASTMIVGGMEDNRTGYNRPRVLLGTSQGKVIAFRVSKTETGEMELSRSDQTRFMELEPSPIVLLSSLRADTRTIIAVGQHAFKSKGNSTKPTKQGVINILATFGNGRKSGLRVRPSLTKHLCDLDVLRLTQGPNKDFRITAAFREQRYSNDLEVFCIYVGYRLESSNFEFKVKEPRRSGIMDLFQLGSGCIAMMAGQDDDRIRIMNNVPQPKQQNDTQHYLHDNTFTPKELEHDNMASPNREETPDIKNDRSELSFTESEAVSPHSPISRYAGSDTDGYGYSPDNISNSRRFPIIRRHEDTTDTRDIDHHVLEEENSFEEKITAARARRQPIVVRHIDTEEEDEDNEQCSLTSSPERVPELQGTAYSFLNSIQHTQQITEFGQEQQSIQREDEIEVNQEQQKDTSRIDVDHEQQNGLAAAPLNKKGDDLGTVPPPLNDPQQLQTLVEEIGIVMNGASQQQQPQPQRSYDNSASDGIVPSESIQPLDGKQDISSEKAYTVFEESQSTQSKYPDLNTLDDQDDNPLITPDNIPPSQDQKDLPSMAIHDETASQDKEDLSISQEPQALTQVESNDANGMNEANATPSALESVDENVDIPDPPAADEVETPIYTQEGTTMPTTIEEEEEDNAMDNTGFLDDLDDYYDEEQVQALAGENSSFAGFLPLASDTAIENNIKLLSDALEGHMTQHLESTVSTPAFDSSQMNGALDDNQQLSMQTTTVPDALSDIGVGRNPSMEHFADKLNQWRPKAVNDTLFVDLLLKQVDPQYIVNDTYLKENASDLLGKLTQNSTQASQALYYLSSLEDVDCGPTLTSLDNVSDHERIKIMVYHMLDQGSYKDAMEYISDAAWVGDALQYKILKTLEKHCDITNFVQTTGIAKRSLNDAMAYVELLWDKSLAEALEYMGSMENMDWQHRCLEWILDRVYQDDAKFDAKDAKTLGAFKYTKERCQQFLKHSKESPSPIAKLALMHYYESQEEWFSALKVTKELEAMPAHTRQHPAYEACLTMDRSVRQSMPDTLRHLPEEIMLNPRGQATGEYKDFFDTHGKDAGFKLFGMALRGRLNERKRKAAEQAEAFPNKR